MPNDLVNVGKRLWWGAKKIMVRQNYLVEGSGKFAVVVKRSHCWVLVGDKLPNHPPQPYKGNPLKERKTPHSTNPFFFYALIEVQSPQEVIQSAQIPCFRYTTFPLSLYYFFTCHGANLKATGFQILISLVKKERSEKCLHGNGASDRNFRASHRHLLKVHKKENANYVHLHQPLGSR